MRQIATIYILIDPFTSQVRYVGKTIGPLSQRYASHLWASGKNKDRKAQWVRSLLKEGERPKVKVLEEVSLEEGDDREVFWISHYRGMGADLVNSTTGGRGIPGYSHTVETKKRIGKAARNKDYSEGYREKLSITKVGRLNPSNKLRGEDVEEIKRLIHQGIKQREIAHRFNVDQSHVSRIKTGAYKRLCKFYTIYGGV